MNKKFLVVGIVAGLAVAAVGLDVAVDTDRSECEALYRKIEVVSSTHDAEENSWRIYIGGVVNLGAHLDSWRATYAGQTFSSTDADVHHPAVSQYGRKDARAGFLGSDLKKLYGGTYKHYSFPFLVRGQAGAAPRIDIEGVIEDGAGKGDVPSSAPMRRRKLRARARPRRSSSASLSSRRRKGLAATRPTMADPVITIDCGLIHPPSPSSPPRTSAPPCPRPRVAAR